MTVDADDDRKLLRKLIAQGGSKYTAGNIDRRKYQRLVELGGSQRRGTPAEYKAGLDRAIEKGWLVLHESGTFVKFTQAGADLFA